MVPSFLPIPIPACGNIPPMRIARTGTHLLRSPRGAVFPDNRRTARPRSGYSSVEMRLQSAPTASPEICSDLPRIRSRSLRQSLTRFHQSLSDPPPPCETEPAVYPPDGAASSFCACYDWPVAGLLPLFAPAASTVAGAAGSLARRLLCALPERHTLASSAAN